MMNMLIMDNDPDFVARAVADGAAERFAVASVPSLEKGLKAARRRRFDVVLLGAGLADGRGVDALPGILSGTVKPPIVLVLAAEPELGEAEKAIRRGAWDYLRRPASITPVLRSLKPALQDRASRGDRGQEKTASAVPFPGVTGRNKAMADALELAAAAFESDAAVHLSGETGTGKELFAHYIHENSANAAGPFVVVDCAALPETLAESILFGHRRGAFTDAHDTTPGLIAQADGGTLFLDEISELPLSVQASFLRVLQERRFRPVGDARERPSKFRILSASNQDLDDAVKKGLFRQDLLFRLRAITIELPPLRERTEDLRALVAFNLERLCREQHLEPKQVSEELLEQLASYDWPGNVRELVQALNRALVVARGETVLFPKHLPTHLRVEIARHRARRERIEVLGKADRAPQTLYLPPIKEIRDAAIARSERKYLHDLLSVEGMDINEACRVAGLSRSRLYALMKAHGVTAPVH